MSSISDVAAEGVSAFETFKRDGEDAILYRRRNDAPEWVEELCHAAHDNGDMFPDDRRYGLIYDALVYVADNADGTPADELEHGFADESVDVYTGNRMDWLASHSSRQEYVDRAGEEYGSDPKDGIAELIGQGQYLEATEVFWAVWNALSNRVDMLDEEEGDDDDA